VEKEEGEERILRFCVSDTGIGIPAEKQNLIFDPFAQADTSTTRKYGGTGLGLTISARLVQMMGGRIWVQSEPDRGSRFYFTTRLKTTESKPQIGTIAPPEILRGVKVLIVDDNLTNQRILKGMLSRWEMPSTAVGGGEEALEELFSSADAGKPYGLILTDMHMPHMDGFDLIAKIRERPDLRTATIMMLTSAGHRGDADRCKALGVAAYLLKPIRQSELREAIARVLGAQAQSGAIPLVTRYSLHDARDSSEVLNILVTEDNPVNQRLATRLLEKRGHRVTVACNGRKAVEALEAGAFDLVFMDVQMPEMDGLEATAAIRRKEAATGKHQPIIALTAHAMKRDQERCIAAGMDGYLTKPIRPQELDVVLERYLALRNKPAASVSPGVETIP
jgi:CheY-like chemotaxis protein